MQLLKHHQATAHNPQSNWKLERSNRTLKAAIIVRDAPSSSGVLLCLLFRLAYVQPLAGSLVTAVLIYCKE